LLDDPTLISINNDPKKIRKKVKASNSHI